MHNNQTDYQTPDFVNIIHELIGDADDPEVGRISSQIIPLL